ncbi:hypothetical protein [Dactylosporangium matsuzakiense]|uniref:Lipoprotein n=1 Tax=Dactylosporangium matsuzakiense TaxID=53360 RepID=A0A9W6KJH0_9ACTN|nr:hypothetical protein [Dactylosporangium matsuzakiense]UWZ43932.1 hypothetical protein Dmats_42025 [Dactylosporangium matsuzakiense]GLL03227.1 hypothetical protein GCM10017581_049710 [Dactylosporangium matsuzakiense]
MRFRTSLVAGLLLVLAAGGCAKDTGADDGVATAGDGKASPTVTASSGTGNRNPKDDQEAFLRFAQCMRDHGVPMEDPNFDGGGVSLSIGGDIDKGKVDAAQAECKQYMPNNGEPPKIDAAHLEEMRKYAQCMRENGVPNFPDPQEEGGFMINSDQLGVDPRGEQMKKAEQACEQYRGDKPGEGGAGQQTESHNDRGGA